MEQPVNFDAFRDITGGDPALEVPLLASFLTTADGCLQKLEQAFGVHDADGWRHHAHALKGVCMNMGAHDLCRLCAEAQNACMAAGELKRVLLTRIQNEYERVRGLVSAELLAHQLRA